MSFSSTIIPKKPTENDENMESPFNNIDRDNCWKSAVRLRNKLREIPTWSTIIALNVLACSLNHTEYLS